MLARDVISGVKAAYYRYDGAADWTVFVGALDLLEGSTSSVITPRTMPATPPRYRPSLIRPISATRGGGRSPSPGEYFQKKIAAEVSCEDAVSGITGIAWLVDGTVLAIGTEKAATLDISGQVDGQHSLQAEVRG